MKTERDQFHTFDALRFFSFFLVFLSHLPYNLFPKFSFLKTRGDIGVYFFFVLSGFLITYIILHEKKATTFFSFKKYMTRRILRIWPLYYLILLFAFLTPIIINFIGLSSTNVGYTPNWLFSSLFLENYMVIYHNKFPNISPLPVIWSLCIEEHFYIVWGVILYFSRKKNIPFWIIAIIICSNISRLLFYGSNLMFKDILTNFDYFMFGAIPAYCFVYRRESIINFINKIPNLIKIGVFLITIFVILSFAHIDFPYKELIEPSVLGLLFMSVILIILPKDNKFKIANSSIFSKLGVYTYGLYLFHVIAINFILQLNNKLRLVISESTLFIALLTMSLLITIVTSRISYVYFEKPFLKLKNKI